MIASVSGYCEVDRTPDPGRYIRRLDEVGATEAWRQIKAFTYELLQIGEGDQVLDVGCGTGDDARALAERVGIAGSVVGVDRSLTMVREARSRAQRTGLPVRLHQGDACHLAFPDSAFDACRAERVLQHVIHPELAIAEMARVVRSGGSLVAIEPDYGTLVIEGGDERLTRRITECRCAHFASGRIGSQLPLLFSRQPIAEIQVKIATLSSTSFDADGQRLRKYAARARAMGRVSAVDADRWLVDLARSAGAGRYRQALTIFIVRGRRR